MREIMVVKTHTTTACYAWFERQQEGLFSWGVGAMTLLPLGVGGGVSVVSAAYVRNNRMRAKRRKVRVKKEGAVAAMSISMCVRW